MRTVAALILGAVVAGSPALAQTAPPLSQFYAACLTSGGAPGLFKEAGSDTFQGGMAALRSYSFTLAPANTAIIVTISRKNAAGALPDVKLYAGQTVIFNATEFSYKHNFKLGEYCLRSLD